MTIFVTGGAGFIGSHVIRRFVKSYPDYNIVNLDCLTYAGNLENLRDVEQYDNYTFLKVDITDYDQLKKTFQRYSPTSIIHLAAESHVDRSIEDPFSFVKTNVMGTLNLLQLAKDQWADISDKRFYHISTDEVYGSLGAEGFFTETTRYDPKSPYSASKASSDHFVRAYANTYKLPILLTNCSNNYGPFQFPEKLIPLMIKNIVDKRPLPVYGKGTNIRDWLHVEDHASAIDLVFHKGQIGETYNIGGLNEWRNIDLIKYLCDLMDEKLGRATGESRRLISFVTDRMGHDARYAIDNGKIQSTLGWSPSYTFEEGIEQTVDWYLHHGKWMESVTSGEYKDYYEKQYNSR